MWLFLKVLPYDPAILLLSTLSKRLEAESQRILCAFMFIVATFTIAKIWKLPKYPPMDEWEKCAIHIVEYYSYFERKILLYTTT